MMFSEGDDSNDKKENLNSTTTQTKILRRNSILKATDFDSKLIDEVTYDETTRIRKARRVSFSQKILVKTIDELQAKPNDSLTEANTQANAKSSTPRSGLKKLNDITNSKNESILCPQNKENLNETSHETSVLPMNTTISPDPIIDPCNATNIDIITMEMGSDYNEGVIFQDNHNKSLDKTIEESVILSNDPNETIAPVLSENLNVSMDSPQASPLKNKSYNLSNSKNMTYEVMDTNLTCKSQYNQDFDDKSQFKINETMTIQGINNRTYNAITEPSLINKTYDLEKTQNINKKMDIEPEKDTLKLTTQSFLNTNSFIQSSTMINEKNKSLNINLSVLNETVSNCADLISNSNQNIDNEMDLLKDRCVALRDKMKLFKAKLIEINKSKKSELEKANRDLDDTIELIQNKKSDIIKIKNEIHKLKLDAASDRRTVKLLNFNESTMPKRQSEIKNLIDKNKNNEKELRDAKKKLDSLKDTVEIGFDQIKMLRMERKEKEKFINLYDSVFDEQFLDFKLLNFDQHLISLAFFNDLIQVQIKATNLVNDLTSKISLNNSLDPNESSDILFDDINKKLKYLNYPIKEINIKTSVDSYGNNLLTRTSRISLSNKYSKNKVPLFVRYCINLILGEFKLDQDGYLILSENKYKFVRDLPIFIARLKLACSCATNLA
ncbi:unnamed protein product, partial [Brachionus calyciflorus]